MLNALEKLQVPGPPLGAPHTSQVKGGSLHQYKRATIELWKFCAVSGSQLDFVARTLESWREHKEERDWWESGASRRRDR